MKGKKNNMKNETEIELDNGSNLVDFDAASENLGVAERIDNSHEDHAFHISEEIFRRDAERQMRDDFENLIDMAD